MILYNGVSSAIQLSIQGLHDNDDITGIWTDLNKYDRSTDPNYCQKLQEVFWDKSFNPNKQTILQYLQDLQQIKYQLPTIFNDNQVLMKVYASLPKEPIWEQARLFMVQNKYTLQQAVAHIQVEFEAKATTVTTPTTPAVAATARHNNRGRGGRRGRGNRGRRGRGGYNSDRVNKAKGKHCTFCNKDNHDTATCYQIKKALKLYEESKGSSKGDDSNNTTPSTYMAPTSTSNIPIQRVRALATLANRNWILDSAATEHFSGYNKDFKSMKHWDNPKSVEIASGDIIKACGSGDIYINTDTGTTGTTGTTIHLRNVWYAPAFQCRLISITKLDYLGYYTTFGGGKAVLKHNNQLVTEGVIIEGIYSIQPNHLTAMPAFSTPENQPKPNQPITPDTSIRSERELYHIRLGHMSYDKLNQLPELAEGIPIFTKQQPIIGNHACEGCQAGKMKESFHKSTDSRSDSKAYRLHMDISGIKITSTQGYHYFILITDDATRYTWIRYSKQKDTANMFPILQDVISQAELYSNNKVIVVRADNGKGEFGQEFQNDLIQKGKQFEPSPPYKHSLNGVIERHIAIINDTTRSLIYHAKLPEAFWDYATEYATWLYNRTPTKALPYKAITAILPYTAWTGKAPKLSMARIFGCTAYLYIPTENRRKLDPRIKPTHILVGMKGESL
jgi:hypothetical protein